MTVTWFDCNLGVFSNINPRKLQISVWACHQCSWHHDVCIPFTDSLRSGHVAKSPQLHQVRSCKLSQCPSVPSLTSGPHTPNSNEILLARELNTKGPSANSPARLTGPAEEAWMEAPTRAQAHEHSKGRPGSA